METGDFGPLLEVLVTCIGVVDVIALFAYLFDRRKQFQKANYDLNNNLVVDDGRWRSELKTSIPTPRGKSPLKSTTRPATPIPELRFEPDGAPQSPSLSMNNDVIEELSAKIFQLEHKISDMEYRERSREVSMERYIEIERFRRSRSPSPSSIPRTLSPPSTSDDSDRSSSRGSSRSHPLSRDDEMRRSVRVRYDSQSSMDTSRAEEIDEFTRLEQEEQDNMDDFVPIEYTEDDSLHPTDPRRQFACSPIQEASCPLHGDMEIEHSPEPGLAEQVELPWGDVKKDQAIIRNQNRWEKARSMSIDEKIEEEGKAMIEPNHENEQIPNELELNEESEIEEIEIPEEELKQEPEPPKTTNKIDDFLAAERGLLPAIETEIKPVESLEITTEIPTQKPIEEPLIIPKMARELSAEPFQSTTPLTEPENIVECQVNELLEPGTPQSARKVTESEVGAEKDKKSNESEESPDKLPSDVSNPIITLNNELDDLGVADDELVNINRNQLNGEGLKRTRRCLNSMDRSISRSPTPLMRRSRSRSRSRVPSEADYKDWFGKFNNQDSPELEVADDFDVDYEEIDEEAEEDVALDNLTDAQIENVIKKKQTSSLMSDVTQLSNSNTNSNGSLPKSNKNNDNSNDVSVSVTFNLNRNHHDDLSAKEIEFMNAMISSDYKVTRRSPNSTPTKLRTAEFLEQERQQESGNRRMSIVPSTEEEQAKFSSFLHPEDFHQTDTLNHQKLPHVHHQHLHNVGYSEWMKKCVEHNSSHLALSDSDSDSDTSLNEIDMLPRFRKETQQRRKLQRTRAVDQPSPQSQST